MLGNIPGAARGITWQVSSYGDYDTWINAVLGQEQEYYSNNNYNRANGLGVAEIPVMQCFALADGEFQSLMSLIS